MAYLLTNLLQDVYRRLGQTNTTILTGGSTSTAIDTKLADEYQDDDLKGGALFVIYDSAGAGAAPEGEFTPITAYDEGTTTMTLSPALTAALASGDRIMFTRSVWPVYEMLELVNTALTMIGDIPTIDTSLTTASDQTEYALPVGLKRKIIKVEVQTDTDSNDNQWKEVQFSVVPAAPGSTGLLIIPQQDAGYTIKIWYEDKHPRVQDYDDPIAEIIDPELAIAACVYQAMQWYVDRTASTDEHWVGRFNQARQDFDNAKREYPIWKPRRKSKILVF